MGCLRFFSFTDIAIYAARTQRRHSYGMHLCGTNVISFGIFKLILLEMICGSEEFYGYTFSKGRYYRSVSGLPERILRYYAARVRLREMPLI